jgi:hypothetical protein
VEKENDLKTQLYLSLKWGIFDIARLLMEKGVWLSLRDNNNFTSGYTLYGTLLETACAKRDFDAVKFFIEAGITPDGFAHMEALVNQKENEYPITIEILQYLLEHGATVDSFEPTSLFVAAKNDNFEQFKIMTNKMGLMDPRGPNTGRLRDSLSTKNKEFIAYVENFIKKSEEKYWEKK